MTKRLIVFITSLMALAFIAGCSPKENEAADSGEVEQHKSEAKEVERPKIEPNDVEAPKNESNEPEPAQAEPNVIETVNAESNKAEPNEVKQPPKVTFHDKCAGILKTYVDDKGMVDYKTLKRKRLELKQLVNEFAQLNPTEYKSWPKEDKIAFWINAYNIQTLKIIIDNYPIQSYSRWLHLLPGWEPDSIRHINKRIGGIYRQKFTVMDEEFTLSEIEQRFFRKEFEEPRVFLGICYATLSSPPLRNEPYYGHKLFQQLDDQAKKFLSSPRAFKINRKKQTVYLSFIFDPKWFGSEFIEKYGTDKKFKDQEPAVRAVLNFLINYISEQNADFLKVKNYSVKFMRHDMRLNDGS